MGWGSTLGRFYVNNYVVSLRYTFQKASLIVAANTLFRNIVVKTWSFL